MFLYVEFEELYLLSLALLASRVGRLMWRAKNGKMKSVSKDENIILQEGKKFILKVKNGSIVNSIKNEGTEGYLPDPESVRAYDCAKEAWSSTLFKKGFSSNNSFIDNLEAYEQVFNYIEENGGLSNKNGSKKIKGDLDGVQRFFLSLSNKIKDLVDEAEIVNSAL